MEASLRTTQRPPRSCTRCAKSKIKCDKSLPCLQCRSRGLAAQCRAETVRFRGVVCTGDVPDATQPSYADLAAENERLRALVSQTSSQRTTSASARPTRLVGDGEIFLVGRLRRTPRRERLHSPSKVLFPSQECVENLLGHGATWTSWLSGAVDQAKFESEVDSFYNASSASRFEQIWSPAGQSWLGMFFAYLTATLLLMTDAEIRVCDLPHSDPVLVQQNWYDSALYFLHEAQFLRILDLRNIQTIVILSSCFINFGDFNLYYHLWGCCVRMGQTLNLQNEYSPREGVETGALLESRLWWALVINDWLQIPLQATHSGVDRIAAGAGFLDSVHSGNEPRSDGRPEYYHLVLAKLSMTLQKFQEQIHQVGDDFMALELATQSVDQEISMIVSQLPKYLQPDVELTFEAQMRNENTPWLSWQKENLCILLLYYRMVINRPLCDQRNSGSESFNKARSVCLEASHGIVATIHEFDSGDPVNHRRLIWTFLLPTFGAAAALKVIHDCPCGTTDGHREEVANCISWFEQAATRSCYAASAAQALQDLPSQ